MNKMIACCGINCKTCEARIATMKNDDKMRVEVAKKWCEMNHTNQITPESINCTGCREEGVKFYFCSHMSEVKKCVAAKGYETCGECRECSRQSILYILSQLEPGSHFEVRIEKRFGLRIQFLGGATAVHSE